MEDNHSHKDLIDLNSDEARRLLRKAIEKCLDIKKGIRSVLGKDEEQEESDFLDRNE